MLSSRLISSFSFSLSDRDNERTTFRKKVFFTFENRWSTIWIIRRSTLKYYLLLRKLIMVDFHGRVIQLRKPYADIETQDGEDRSKPYYGMLHRIWRYICIIHPHHTSSSSAPSSNWKRETGVDKGQSDQSHHVVDIHRIYKIIVLSVGVHFDWSQYHPWGSLNSAAEAQCGCQKFRQSETDWIMVPK
jgi:hypothetical protein